MAANGKMAAPTEVYHTDRIEPPHPDMMGYQAEPREYQAQRYLFQPSLHTDQLHDQNHFDDVSIVDPRQNHHRQSFHQQRSEVNYLFYRKYLCKTYFLLISI